MNNYDLLKGVLLASAGVCKASDLRCAFISLASVVLLDSSSKHTMQWARCEAGKVMSAISHLRTLKRKSGVSARPGLHEKGAGRSFF